MDFPKLSFYLHTSQTNIHKKIDLLVMGNEAADLDSMASALVFAYIRAAKGIDLNIVPLIPIARADFKLRPEAVYVFDQAQINPAHLVFLDDITLPSFMDRVDSIALLDHNKLSSLFEPHGEKISIIMDHHKDQDLYHRVQTRVIEPVGSCATLVGELLIRDYPALLDRCLSILLGSAILLDTVNLDPNAGRVTPKDTRVARHLLGTWVPSQNQYFKPLQKAKFNTSGLTTHDLLRKDYKEFEFGSLRFGISSAFLSIRDWWKKDPDFCLGFETYARSRHLDLLISMNAYENQEFKRDLGVYCPDQDIHDRVISALIQNGLGLKSLSLDTGTLCLHGRISFHAQGRTQISRKRLVPLLDEYFS